MLIGAAFLSPGRLAHLDVKGLEDLPTFCIMDVGFKKYIPPDNPFEGSV